MQWLYALTIYSTTTKNNDGWGRMGQAYAKIFLCIFSNNIRGDGISTVILRLLYL